jgi:hypothetical protein
MPKARADELGALCAAAEAQSASTASATSVA